MPGTGIRSVGTNSQSDPLTTFQFYVQIDGLTEAVFTELAGLEVTTEVTDQPEGGENTHVHRLLGRTKVGDITLKNGVTTSKQLWNWYKSVIQGPPWTGSFSGRKHISIIMVDQQGREAQRWNLQYAIPIKWTGPQFNTSGSTTAVQSLTFTHKGLLLNT
ncbi:MAG TPA: phage tail protein [Chloroflexia bacterium]|nr:phage tail protein [Chloroflexia bacterium]